MIRDHRSLIMGGREGGQWRNGGRGGPLCVGVPVDCYCLTEILYLY